LTGDDQKQKIKGIQHVDEGEEYVEFHPVFFDTPSDHDSHIGHYGC